MRLDAPLFLWWSRSGAEQGRSWWTKQPGQEPQQFSHVRFVGIAETLAPNGAALTLPEGPRGVVFLLDGFAEVS